MKNYFIYLFILLLFSSCKKEIVELVVVVPPVIDTTVKKDTTNTTNTTNTTQPINLVTHELSFVSNNVLMSDLYGTLKEAVSGFLHYEVDSIEHIIMTPSFSNREYSPIHFFKKNNQWIYESTYYDVLMGNARNYNKIKNGTFAYADHGLEFKDQTPWPQGHIWKVETKGYKLVWTQVSKYKSFYHSVCVGDYNQDGKIDIIGQHMGSRFNPNRSDGLHVYVDNNINYTEDNEYIEPLNKTASLGSVYSVDLDGDKIDEIIVSDYGFNPQFQKVEDRTTFKILKYKDKKYRYTKEFPTTGFFKFLTIGSTSMKSSDIDKDGDMDILIAFEGEKSGIEIWKNNGNLEFAYIQTIGFKPEEMSFREFEISDINNDGYEDILLHPFHNSTSFTPSNNGVNLEKCIWINNKGIYNSYTKPLFVPSIRPGFLKGFFINGKLKFIGPEYSGDNKFKIHEININL